MRKYLESLTSFLLNILLQLLNIEISFSKSPRDSTGGLGVKMVEYVLGGSPTNKDSPLALDGRFKNLKIDDVKVIIDSFNTSNVHSDTITFSL